jgi:hypothetical protein
MRRALVAGAFMMLACPVFAQSNQERYILQERCGKQAAATFKSEWASNVTNTDKGQVVANYQNHYSERLNKCFYLEISTTYEKVKDKTESLKMMRLYDINENKEYANYTGGLLCTVNGTSCGSEQEFTQLIKQYMEN